MKRTASLVVAALLLATTSLIAATAKPIWMGKSGGFEFQWTTGDIKVVSISAPQKILYSAARLFQKQTQKNQDDNAEVKLVLDEAEQTLQLLSVVGPIMSVESHDYSYYKGTAHPSLYSRFTAIDFRNPNRIAQLSDYFPAEDIRKALLQDKLVQNHLGKNKPAATLDGLVRQLADLNIDLDICEYGFDKDLLTRFAFYQIQDGKVAVRLGLSYGGEPCRGMLTQIGLWLAIPDTLRSALKTANDRQEGFLMDSQTTRNQATLLTIKGPTRQD